MKWTVGTKSEFATHNANIVYEGENGICQIYGIPSHTTLEDVDVTRYGAGLNHAHLIAAAPELLKALKGCRQRWLDAARNPAFWDAGELRDLADIDAAIRKAEGK